MPQPPVPLSMLLVKDVHYEWHDGVALVAQLVAQVRPHILEAQGRIPDLRAVTLEEDGTLTLSARPDQAMPSMPGAAQILQQLLSGKEQPVPLRLYLMQAATAEPPVPLDSFAAEVAKWERPNRMAKLSALYFRALEQIGPAALTEQSRAREDRAQNAKGPIQARADTTPGTKKTKKATAPKHAHRSNRLVVVALFGAVVALVAASAAWFMIGRPTPGSLVRANAALAQVAPGDDAKEAVTPGPGAPTPPKAAPRRAASTPRRPSAVVGDAEAELARAKELFQRQEYAAASVAFERVLEILGTEPSPQAEEIRQIARSLAEVARAAIAINREYRTGDAGVVDPVPLAYLPPKPDPNTPPGKLQVLEVHVNTSGTVDSAKFVMNRPSFRNSWWLSAAKAWRFSPAMRDGKPVRFVMRIVMDDSAHER